MVDSTRPAAAAAAAAAARQRCSMSTEIEITRHSARSSAASRPTGNWKYCSSAGDKRHTVVTEQPKSPQLQARCSEMNLRRRRRTTGSANLRHSRDPVIAAISPNKSPAWTTPHCTAHVSVTPTASNAHSSQSNENDLFLRILSNTD